MAFLDQCGDKHLLHVMRTATSVNSRSWQVHIKGGKGGLADDVQNEWLTVANVKIDGEEVWEGRVQELRLPLCKC